jgi:peptidoglycan/LPS O-acetylase OafA/YrhL
VPEIDGLRFVAIASVVLYHFHGFALAAYSGSDTEDTVRALAEHGYRGVNLFYVISGFVLGLPFAAHHLTGKPAVRLRSYFLRRLTRLEPPYVLNLLICFVLAVLTGENAKVLLPHLGASLLYLHNLVFGNHSSINPVAWTLEIEVQFYCLVPLLAWIFAVKSRLARRATLAALILLAGIIQTMHWSAPPRVQLTILYAIQFFLAGFLLADIYLVNWEARPASRWTWDLVSLMGWPLVFLPADLKIWIGLPFLILAVYVAAFKGIAFRWFFTNRAVTIIGGMCYSIYLFHYVLIPDVLRLLTFAGVGHSFNEFFVVEGLFYAAILLLVSGTYFVLVERPCMQPDWPRRAAALFGRVTRLRSP